LTYACTSEKLYESLLGKESGVPLRVFLGDDLVRAELDLRRPPHKRFVLFDLKMRVRQNGNAKTR
jgi:hypothetical protein